MRNHRRQMINHNRRALFIKFGIALGLLSVMSQASAERWYRVELLAFSQRGGELSETWPATPELAYPEEGRFLMTRDELSSTITQDASESTEENLATTQSQTIKEEEMHPGTPPFVVLPETRKQFADAADTMARSGRYKVLFHETWIQPVGSKRSAVPLILDRSGDTGQWPLLQGSMTLWLSRYLHLETNLWLNTQGEYLQGEWQMPAPPLGPRAVANASGNALFSGDAPEPEPPVNQTDASRFYWEEGGENQPAANAYPYRHAIALKQKRRMRSKEIHYIDHPMLGLMIEITPLETADDSLTSLSSSQQLPD